jgi:hypothetical protein
MNHSALPLALALTLGLAIGTVLGAVVLAPRGADPASSTDAATLDPGASPEVDRLSESSAEEPLVASRPVPASAPSSTATVPERLTEQRVDAALTRVAAPSVQGSSAFKGQMTAIVKTADGSPVPGVVVQVTRSREPSGGFGGSALGEAAPEILSLEEHLREAADRWAEERADRRRAVTDDAGLARLTGLDENAPYRINAYLEDWKIDLPAGINFVKAGDEFELIAKRLEQVRLDLAGPDGASIAEAKISLDGLPWNTSQTWTAERPWIKLKPGLYRVRAQAERLELPIHWNLWPFRLESEWADLRVEQGSNESTLLTLEQVGIVVVHLDRGSRPSDEHLRIQVDPLPDGVELDSFQFDFGGNQLYSNGNVATSGSLEFGRYAVGLLDQHSQPLVRAEVQVGPEPARVDLKVPEKSVEDQVRVSVLDPEGRPLPGVDLSLSMERKGGGSSTAGLRPRMEPDGTCLISPSETFGTNRSADASFKVIARHDSFGEVRAELPKGQSEVTLRFETPGSLRVTVRGYASSGLAGKFQLNVAKKESNHMSSYSSSRSRRPQLDANGVVEFEALTPGNYLISGTVQGDTPYEPGSTVLSEEIEVAPGHQERIVNIPVLHEVVVSAPELEVGESIRMQALNRQSGLRNSYRTTLGEDRRAVFGFVPSGKYTVRANGSGGAMEIEVPCGEVVLETKQNTALQISLSSTSGGLASAGFEAGDLILGIDGVRAEGTSELFDRIQEGGSVTFLVLRSGEQLDLEVDLDAHPLQGSGAGGFLVSAPGP